ncbi:glycosyltransferase family 25 protein [Salmonella enterica subsp. arizonae serovar 63:z36:-]|nr:glycosyltransferase family 25 protein [Salmonella enterica subsp. arizonae serovar 63:z36:-]HCL5372368.1 glycosyltransferase family 25 protein [Salmonella enterica]
MQINVYVISLEDEFLRRNIMCEQLNGPFTFINAVDLRKIKSITITKYLNNDKLPYPKVRTNLTNGEIGCALSHLKALNKFVEDEGEYALILEDDAILPTNYLDVINNICSNSKGYWDFLLLGYSKLDVSETSSFYKMEPINILQKINNISIGEPWKNWTSGTVAYLVSKQAARRFIEVHNRKIFTVADDWAFFKGNFDFKILHCRPLIIFENYAELKSSIELERGTFISYTPYYLKFIRICRGYIRKLFMLMR